MKTIYLVVPCYNEEEVLPETAKQLNKKMRLLQRAGKITEDSRIVLVDDGSDDRTWRIIEKLNEKMPTMFSGLRLSRNEGHQNALYAGLMQVKDLCDAAISLDADMQDDIDAIDEMVDKFEDGNDIVYGVRSDRDADTAFKRGSAQRFYKLINAMGAEVVYDHADYRLMSRRAIEALAEFKEVNLFLRGLVPMIGFTSDVTYYIRGERLAGETKYPTKKMFEFAWQGITSLSAKPIRMISTAGCVLFVISILVLIYSLVRHLLGFTVVGWTSMMFSIWAIGGLQLVAIGIVGEYVGKVYLESKGRPRYIVETWLHGAPEQEEETEG